MNRTLESVGVIGAGAMGGALALRISERHDVIVTASSPSSENLKRLTTGLSKRIRPGTLDECASCDVTILTVPWSSVGDVTSRLSKTGVKSIISVVVPYDGDESSPAIAAGDSSAETIARSVPSASVANAFTSISAETILRAPDYAEKPSVFVASDDAATKSLAMYIASMIGFDAVDAGPLYAARFTEMMGFLWTSLAFQARLGEYVSFKIVNIAATSP